MKNLVAEARVRLAALEADPKHGHSAEGAAQSRVDRLDDPKHQGKVEQDPKWHQDKDGNWTHEDFEEE